MISPAPTSPTPLSPRVTSRTVSTAAPPSPSERSPALRKACACCTRPPSSTCECTPSWCRSAAANSSSSQFASEERPGDAHALDRISHRPGEPPQAAAAQDAHALVEERGCRVLTSLLVDGPEV